MEENVDKIKKKAQDIQVIIEQYPGIVALVKTAQGNPDDLTTWNKFQVSQLYYWLKHIKKQAFTLAAMTDKELKKLIKDGLT